jgi:hypothetical protein
VGAAAMKLYERSGNASMDMQADHVLATRLTELIGVRKIDVAIETGTFLGLGSTKMVAEAFLRTAPPKHFVTIEVNFANWCRAKGNLRVLPFVDCRWGLSVPLERAVNFLRNDDMLINHKKYENIYIDNITDPVAAYTNELLGQAVELERQPLSAQSKDIKFDGKDYLYDGEDLLGRLIDMHADHSPLIILDSAGGTGFLEFQIVMEKMTNKNFHILLDDIHHVKHYRSYDFIKRAPKFTVFAHSQSWVLASHRRG